MTDDSKSLPQGRESPDLCLSTETQDLKDSAESIQTVHQEADHIIRLGEQIYICLGEVLCRIEDNGLWDKGNFPALQHYLEASRQGGGLGLASHAHQRCRRVYRKFREELGVPMGRLLLLPKQNLLDVLGVVNRDNLEEVLSDAEVLTNRDLRENRSRGKYCGVEEKLDAQAPTAPPPRT